LLYELVQRGLRVETGKAMSVMYKGNVLDCGYRLDLLVERSVIVELKVVEQSSPIHAAPLLTYLKLSGHPVGLLINFNVRLLRDGLRRLVLDLPEKLGAPSVLGGGRICSSISEESHSKASARTARCGTPPHS
jgi:GxxExxY protein